MGELSDKDLEKLSLEELRQERLRREREWLLTPEGFLDFVRWSGAAPDAEYQPHGRYAHDLVTWSGEPDPDKPDRMLYKWKLTLWPRSSFKSQCFNVGLAAWMIACDPNIRILVCSETNRQAKAFVQETMKIIDSEWYVERFGRHKSKEWRIGSGTFVSAQRNRKGIKDPTIRCAGVGEVQTGSHWDLVIMDDICSQENTKTTESIESLWHWFGETMAQLDPGCKLFMIGTLHHFSDIYCRILKDPKIRKLFEISKHGWCSPLQDPHDDLAEGAELFFPNRLTPRFVASQKDIMPPRLFACFYENRPTTSEEQIFKPEYFQVIRDHEIPRQVWTYIMTDFAFTAEEKKSKRADQTVFWVVSLDANRYAYVREVVIGRWRPSDSCRILCKLWEKYRSLDVKAVTVEKNAFEELISSLLEEIRRDTMTRPKIVPIPGRTQETKDMRIEAMEPRFRNGMVYFAESFRHNHAAWKKMFEEMVEWPLSTHDDIPDAISDLDKRDKDGKLFCPGPPPGWAGQPVRPTRHPEIVSGKFNPARGWDPRESTQEREHDLWKASKSRPLGGNREGRSDSYFGKRMPPRKR